MFNGLLVSTKSNFRSAYFPTDLNRMIEDKERNGFESRTPAQTVGNQFVSQYYTVLHSSPKHLHRFYADNSTMTHVDVVVEDGTVTQSLKTATGQKMINETVMNLDLEDTITEIYSVDSQYSLAGSVVVQVTGVLQNNAGLKRSFVQTFFLAVQEKGYYVLNDIFRYLLPNSSFEPNGSESKGAPEVKAKHKSKDKRSSSPPAVPTPRPPHQNGTPEGKSGSKETEHVFQFRGNASDGSKKQQRQKHKFVETVQYSEGGSDANSEPRSTGREDDGSQDEMVEGFNANQENGNVSSHNVPATEGVFIRDIPAEVTIDELERALKRFGSIKDGSLSVKSMKGRDSYAFVDFLSIDSAKVCLTEGMEFQGKKVSVEPKRPTIFRQGINQTRKFKNTQSRQHHQHHRQMHPMAAVPHAYPAMQFPHGHMLVYPNGMGMPVSMGMPIPAVVPRMQPRPPPPPPPQSIPKTNSSKSEMVKDSDGEVSV